MTAGELVGGRETAGGQMREQNGGNPPKRKMNQFSVHSLMLDIFLAKSIILDTKFKYKDTDAVFAILNP